MNGRLLILLWTDFLHKRKLPSLTAGKIACNNSVLILILFLLSMGAGEGGGLSGLFNLGNLDFPLSLLGFFAIFMSWGNDAHGRRRGGNPRDGRRGY